MNLHLIYLKTLTDQPLHDTCDITDSVSTTELRLGFATNTHALVTYLFDTKRRNASEKASKRFLDTRQS